MPRQTRKREQPSVRPTNSLVASAARYTGKAARIYQPDKAWQRECYRHYAICGEARFAAKFFGHALSRAVLGVSKKSTKGLVPEKRGRGVETLGSLFNGQAGQSQMLSAIGTHFTIAGECYLVGRTVTDDDGRSADVWEIVSVLEIDVNGKKWSINYHDGKAPVDLADDDVVIRLWIPDPSYQMQADSPFRALLPVLREIEWLTKHIFAQCQSRLAGAGVLMLPQEMSFPPPPKQDEQEEQRQPSNSADSFMLTLADSMLTPIGEPDSPSALVPIVVQAPGEHIDKAKLLQFWSEMDENVRDMRDNAIRRFALGMDLPPEQVLGMSSNPGTGGGNSNGVSHWGAWQIEESTIKLHVEPMLELVANALTIGYIRPLLDSTYVVTYDTSALRLRPDRSKEAMELYDRGRLSAEALLRENGFDPEKDAPSRDEFKDWLLRKVASGSATPDQVAAALKALGVDLGPPAPGPQQQPREARPDPSLLDHPVRPRDPSEHPEAAALLAAADALVWRALERAGNRIRQKAGVKPPNTPAYEMHTLVAVNGDADRMLDDAWSCAPQVLEGVGAEVDSTVAMLDAYCRALLHEQAPHSRERLSSWLARNDGKVDA